MPYCRKCGREIKESERFCPSCGAPVGEAVIDYRKPRERGWPIGRIIIVVIGLIVILTSFGLLVGGTGIMIATRTLSDQEGFLLTEEADLRVDSYAIVGKGINIEIDPTSRLFLRRLGDFITFKLVATSNDPSKELFIGLAMEENAREYLRDVWYHEVEEFHWSYGPWCGASPEVSYTVHQGESPTGPPTMHSFWVALSTGPGPQELEWEPEVGNYWIVTMNGDGSAVVDTSIRIGAKVPLLQTIGNSMVAGGIIALLIGGALLYLGIFRKV